MASQYLLISIAIIYIGCTVGVVDASCDQKATCSTDLVTLAGAVRLWTDSSLNNYCALVSAFKTCLEGISCTSTESTYYDYKIYLGIANGVNYACTSDVRAVFKNNDACISTLKENDLLTTCGSTSEFWAQTSSSGTTCTKLNTWLRCAYNYIRAKCNADVARVEGWTTVKILQPIEEALSCTIETSYISGAKPTSANLLMILSFVCMAMIGLFRY